MPYSPPAGNAVAFSFPAGAYSAPAGNAVTLTFPPNIPTVNFSGKSTLSLQAFGWVVTNTAISGSTVFVPETSSRSYAIPSGSTFVADTWLRHLVLDVGSTPSFRAGATATVVSSGDFSVVGIAALIANYAFGSSSALAGDWRSYNNAKFDTATSRSVFSGAAVFNKPMRMIVFSDTTLALTPRFVTPSVPNIASGSVLSARGAPYLLRVFSVPSSSQLSAVGRAVANSTALIQGTSDIVGVNQPSRGGSFNITAPSAASFVSSYTQNPITLVPVDADSAYVTVRKPVLHVRA